MKTFDISSNKVTFNNCLLDEVIEVLDGQYAISKRSASRAAQRLALPIGSVEVTVINPVP